MTNKTRLCAIEKRFKLVTGIDCDMAVFPVKDGARQKTDKKDIEKYGFVPTPLDIVDKMVYQAVHENPYGIFVDLCCGCGQFATRLLRKLANDGIMDDVDYFIRDSIILSEINPESVAKAIYVFGSGINILIGDASKFKFFEFSDDNDKSSESTGGMMFWNGGKWVNDQDFSKNVETALENKSKEDWRHVVNNIAKLVADTMGKYAKDEKYYKDSDPLF